MAKNVSKEETDRILRHHIWASIGAGMIPVPVADIAGLTGVQLNMLRKLAEVYEVPFLKEAVEKMLTSLIGGVLLKNTAPLAASLIKSIPIIGQTIGSLTMPITCGASTYATGKVFVLHFDSGGTFLTFDPKKMKTYYAKMFEEGKRIAAEIRNNRKET